MACPLSIRPFALFMRISNPKTAVKYLGLSFRTRGTFSRVVSPFLGLISILGPSIVSPGETRESGAGKESLQSPPPPRFFFSIWEKTDSNGEGQDWVGEAEKGRSSSNKDFGKNQWWLLTYSASRRLHIIVLSESVWSKWYPVAVFCSQRRYNMRCHRKCWLSLPLIIIRSLVLSQHFVKHFLPPLFCSIAIRFIAIRIIAIRIIVLTI